MGVSACGTIGGKLWALALGCMLYACMWLMQTGIYVESVCGVQSCQTDWVPVPLRVA